MNRRLRTKQVSVKNALIFVSKRAENNIKRLTALEKTLEEVSGEDGGEKEFEELKKTCVNHTEKVDHLLNRTKNLESLVKKNVELDPLLKRVSNLECLIRREVEKKYGNQIKMALNQFSSLRKENRLLLEKLSNFNSLQEEFKQLEEVVKSNQVDTSEIKLK